MLPFCELVGGGSAPGTFGFVSLSLQTTRPLRAPLVIGHSDDCRCLLCSARSWLWSWLEAGAAHGCVCVCVLGENEA